MFNDCRSTWSRRRISCCAFSWFLCYAEVITAMFVTARIYVQKSIPGCLSATDHWVSNYLLFLNNPTTFLSEPTNANRNISGKEDAGIYEKIPNVTFNGCIEKCCESDGCNIVFMNRNDCYTVWYLNNLHIITSANCTYTVHTTVY